MKIGYFSPLSPIKSGISEYSERELLPYLMKYCEIDLIIDKGYIPSSEFIKKNFNIISYDKFENRYDVLLYHMGNNPYHEYIYKTALKHPGVVVLHDPFLHHLQIHMTIAQHNQNEYRQIMEYCLGSKGKKIADNALISYNWPQFEYPLVKKLVDSSMATIVHSDYAKKTIFKETKKRFVKIIKMPIKLPSVSKNDDLRKKLKIPSNSIIISTFGHVGFYKRIDVVLKAFAKYLKTNPNAVFLIVGSFQDKKFETEIHKLQKELRISNKVIETGYVKNLFPYIQISDIIIQLRYPTAGETSIITLQILGSGKPVLVSNVGSFPELDDDIVIKINVDKNEISSIVKNLERLSTEKEYAHKFSTKSKRFIQQEHDPENIAYEFFDFLSYITKKDKINFMAQVTDLIQNSEFKKISSENLDDVITMIQNSNGRIIDKQILEKLKSCR